MGGQDRGGQDREIAADAAAGTIDVSIVMPCLDEVRALPTAIASARAALETLAAEGLAGEIVIADNGSTDGSQAMAESLGARVVPVAERGYGAALAGGFQAARGRYLVMGDADGSYDFRDSVAMVGALQGGADLCMGSRFRGGIAPGAMPWKNHYIGNPVLTGILNLLFRTGVDDAHCGLRALTKGCVKRLALRGSGMEFASEMVIKAALKGERIAEVPATLSRDVRGRPPHLRPWRDGWRHLRYLLMLSPTWAFAVPAGVMGGAGLLILLAAGISLFVAEPTQILFGNYWVILAGALVGLGHSTALLAAATHLYGVRAGYRRPAASLVRWSRWVSLETMLAGGTACFAAGLAVLLGVVGYWSHNGYGPIGTMLPAVVGTSLLVVGTQTGLGGFLLAVIGGNEAAFLARDKSSNLIEGASNEVDPDRIGKRSSRRAA
ncbi:glycosyltransferase family 2 protein [Methylobacterium sp. J-092]|uniref:glycosyltransferase family 2 protein n=1 Tax=Methylobacterium sp. J-092 TaxID=2836667 RepID=UPI001FBA6367|nr:glycosyltransferase family 2 protein [Methylobacterium sp. J-092]MCJ2006714.1 glycosyltransferase family 2 protein [Methylobacterium sp. J-092]